MGASAASVDAPEGQKLSSNEPLSQEALEKIAAVFHKMDDNGDGTVVREEALSFFKQGGAFAKVSTDAMFNEVDGDTNGEISKDEFTGFWEQVKQNGYSEEDILEELSGLIEGGGQRTWIDWQDGRDVGT